jgi:ribonuclease VapC
VIVIDTSALVAIANHEPERPRFLEVLAESDRRIISALTLLETRMVTIGRFGPAGAERLSEWLDIMKPEIVPFDHAQATAAYEAFLTYGKGIHPRARLNLCDCAAYALARSLGAPLLFKGSDFAATDVTSAAQL